MNSFLSMPMRDAEVRLFIQEDLPLLQSFGYPGYFACLVKIDYRV